MKISRLIKPIFLLIVSILFTLLGLELIIRIYKPQPLFRKLSPLDFDKNTSLPLKTTQGEELFKNIYFSNDKERNHYGFHDTEHSFQTPPDTYRIILIGDSFAEVEHFPLNDTWFERLEKKLEEKLTRKIEIINLGIRGAGTAWESFILDNLGIKYKPDMLLLTFHLGSDFFNNHPRLETKLGKPFFKISQGKISLANPLETETIVRGIYLPLWRISHLYRYAHRNLYKIERSYRITKTGMPVLFEQYLTNPPSEWQQAETYTEFYLKQILDITNKNSCQLIVVIIPDKYQIQKDNWQKIKNKWPIMKSKKWDMNAPEKKLTKILNKLEISYINLTPIFQEKFSQGKKLYFEKDIHWNKLGNLETAGIIADNIEKYIK